MTGEPQSDHQKAQARQNPNGLRRPKVVRVFRAFLREINKHRARDQKGRTDHQINERMMARWTRRVGWFTLSLVIVGVITAGIFKRQLDTMQGQLDAMEADQRPWVRVDLEIASGVTYSETQAKIVIRAKVQNVGHSPAFNLNFWPKVIPWRLGIDVLPDDPLKARCDEMSVLTTMPMIAWGKLLFPGESDQISENAWIDIPKKQPPAPEPPPLPPNSVVSPYFISPAQQPFFNPNLPMMPLPPLDYLLLSCVYYESRSGPKRPHHTAESAVVGLLLQDDDPTISLGGALDFASRQTIPKDKLGLFRPNQVWRHYGD